MSRTIKARRGAERECKSWQAEAALRMLRNNLDPENAERPGDLVVYGGRGKAARNWEAFEAIERALINLEEDETLMVQSGKPVAVKDLKNIADIAVGYQHACAVDQQGKIYCWGYNSSYQLGDGTTTSSKVPVAAVKGITDAIAVRDSANTGRRQRRSGAGGGSTADLRPRL